MGVQILDKDVSVISSIANVAKARISNVGGIGGWAGGGPASQGPQAGSTAVNDTFIGNISWTNPTNIFSTSWANGYTSAVLTLSQETYCIKATNFGFSIPTGATVNGIIVNINRYQDDGYIVDSVARIVKGGVIGTTDKSKGEYWPVTTAGRDTPATYGSSTDLWGETWTPSDINSSNFGFALGGRIDTFSKFNWGCYLFGLKITVHYTT